MNVATYIWHGLIAQLYQRITLQVGVSNGPHSMYVAMYMLRGSKTRLYQRITLQEGV